MKEHCPECGEILVDDPDDKGTWLVCNECGNYYEVDEGD